MFTLINPPGIQSNFFLQAQSPKPPLGLAFLAGTLEKLKAEYHLIDAAGLALDRLEPIPNQKGLMQVGLSLDEIVDKIHPKTACIGISALFSILWPATRDLSYLIREKFPNVPIVFGGEHANSLPEECLRTSAITHIATGEGEGIVAEIVKNQYKNLNSIDGLCFIENGIFKANPRRARLELNKMPKPNWSQIPLENYWMDGTTQGTYRGRSLPILATRGCPYECTFCTSPNMLGKRYIKRPPTEVADEMEHWIEKYKIDNFDFCDLTAVVNRRWTKDLCNEIINRGLNISWQMPQGTRSEAFDDELSDLLYKSGCRNFGFAPETGDAETLKLIKKQVNIEKMRIAIRSAVKHKLNVSCFLVYGFPKDTKKSLRQSIILARKFAVWGVDDIAVNRFTPYPGTELAEYLKNRGKIILDDDFFYLGASLRSSVSATYTEFISQKYLNFMMIYTYINFYGLSFILRPHRMIWNFIKLFKFGIEETSYVKHFVVILQRSSFLNLTRKFSKLHRASHSKSSPKNFIG